MAIIYGRRRIGKMALIRKFCEGKPVFFYTARAWKDAFQLEEFSQAVGTFNHNPQQCFLDWPAALRTLAIQPCDARKVIVSSRWLLSLLTGLKRWKESASVVFFLTFGITRPIGT